MTAEAHVVDARGLRCPLPVVRLAAAARVLGPDRVVHLLSDDPAAEVDVAAWCRMRGHTLVAQVHDEGHLRSEVRTAATAPAS
ncbi:MAG: sulfurtransferase TusA family protein [Kineosporiaceae bacterium]